MAQSAFERVTMRTDAKLGYTRDELAQLEEGKKKGRTTSLPIALGTLQMKGAIRRIPIDGRLDQERYAYELWADCPLATCGLDRNEAFQQLA